MLLKYYSTAIILLKRVHVAEPLGLPVSSRFHTDFTEKAYTVLYTKELVNPYRSHGNPSLQTILKSC